MNRILFTLFLFASSFLFAKSAFAQETMVPEASFVAPEEMEVRAPIPRRWAPRYRRCPRGSFFVPSEYQWNGSSWVFVKRDVCEFRAGSIYVEPYYGAQGGVVRYRPGHWAPASWHGRYYRPESPYYRRPYGSSVHVPPPYQRPAPRRHHGRRF